LIPDRTGPSWIAVRLSCLAHWQPQQRERIPMKRDVKDRSAAFRAETGAALLLLATYAAAIAAVIVAIAFICRPLAC
jgi:hypothetical protein